MSFKDQQSTSTSSGQSNIINSVCDLKSKNEAMEKLRSRLKSQNEQLSIKLKNRETENNENKCYLCKEWSYCLNACSECNEKVCWKQNCSKTSQFGINVLTCAQCLCKPKILPKPETVPEPQLKLEKNEQPQIKVGKVKKVEESEPQIEEQLANFLGGFIHAKNISIGNFQLQELRESVQIKHKTEPPSSSSPPKKQRTKEPTCHQCGFPFQPFNSSCQRCGNTFITLPDDPRIQVGEIHETHIESEQIIKKDQHIQINEPVNVENSDFFLKDLPGVSKPILNEEDLEDFLKTVEHKIKENKVSKFKNTTSTTFSSKVSINNFFG